MLKEGDKPNKSTQKRRFSSLSHWFRDWVWKYSGTRLIIQPGRIYEERFCVKFTLFLVVFFVLAVILLYVLGDRMEPETRQIHQEIELNGQ